MYDAADVSRKDMPAVWKAPFGGGLVSRTSENLYMRDTSAKIVKTSIEQIKTDSGGRGPTGVA